MADKLLTVEELALMLNVKPSTLRKWTHLRSIPYLKLGRSVRFDADRVARWISKGSVEVKTWER